MPRGQLKPALTAADLRAKIKEIKEREKERVAEVEEKIKALSRRAKFLSELKAWMGRRKLTPLDLLAMYREMQPRRADAPVKSKNPLQPKSGRWADKPRPHRGGVGATDMFMHNGKLVPKRGDPEFRKAIHEARIAKGMKVDEVGKKIGISGASVGNWEQGRNVPKEEQRAKIVKLLGLPDDLGKDATLASAASMGGSKRQGSLALNGAAAH
jgi:ribosome-binding protein aMBF1 (putative translation factor)